MKTTEVLFEILKMLDPSQAHNRLLRMNVPELLQEIRLRVRYLQFDLEATRREATAASHLKGNLP